MVVYRIGRTRFAADLNGEGARLYGGRWNQKLTPCIYASESRALALLEYTANVNIEDIPRALSLTKIGIPEEYIFEVPLGQLPGNWNAIPAPGSTKDLGSALINKGLHLIIKVPSVIIPDEFNYLLNPVHSASSLIRIIEINDFIYDVRLKLK